MKYWAYYKNNILHQHYRIMFTDIVAVIENEQNHYNDDLKDWAREMVLIQYERDL